MINDPGQLQPANNPIRFSVIGDAWRYFWAQPWPWLGASVIYTILVCITLVAEYFLSGDDERIFLRFDAPHLLLLGVLMNAISRFGSAGLLRMALRQIDGHTISVGDMFKIGDIAGSLALASLMIAIPATIASEFFLWPMLFVEAAFLFALPAIIDKRLDAQSAVSLSWNTLKRHWLMATLLIFVLMLVTVSGALVCGVGLLVSGSLYYLASARLYRDFFPLPDTAPPPVPQPGEPFSPIPEVPQ